MFIDTHHEEKLDLPTDHNWVGCMDELFPTRCMVSPNEVEE